MLNYELIILLAVTAYVFSDLLSTDKMIFRPYFNLIEKLPKYFSFPLGVCNKCFAGQISLWYFLFKENRIDAVIFSVMLTILITKLIEDIHYKLK